MTRDGYFLFVCLLVALILFTGQSEAQANHTHPTQMIVPTEVPTVHPASHEDGITDPPQVTIYYVYIPCATATPTPRPTHEVAPIWGDRIWE